MTISEYFRISHDVLGDCADGAVSEGNISYTKASVWYNSNGVEQTSCSTLPGTATAFEAQSIGLSNGIYANAVVSKVTGAFFNINRTWSTSTIDALDDSTKYYSPAAYYIQYQICL